MGRATRWLLNLMGAGSNNYNNKQKKDPSTKDHLSGCSADEVEKKRWSFWKSRATTGEGASSRHNASTAAAIETAWFKSFYAGSEREQSKHAIAVAEAAAAAADAAVIAARAAAAAARISSRRGVCGAQERWAAVKIQTAYRGHLARKALRALKALVKIQALVRGFLVRKQADAALHSLRALIRAQATVRARRHRNLLAFDSSFQPQVRHRRSFERLSDTRSDRTAAFQSLRLSANLDRSTKTIEIDTSRPKSRSSRLTSPSALSASGVRADRAPARIALPCRRNFIQENESWCIAGGRSPATAQLATPRCMHSSRRGSAAATPARSPSGSSSPNYMADTRSSKAKARSHGTRKRQPLRELNVQEPRFLSQEGLDSEKAVGGRRVGSSSESEVFT